MNNGKINALSLQHGQREVFFFALNEHHRSSIEMASKLLRHWLTVWTNKRQKAKGKSKKQNTRALTQRSFCVSHTPDEKHTTQFVEHSERERRDRRRSRRTKGTRRKRIGRKVSMCGDGERCVLWVHFFCQRTNRLSIVLLAHTEARTQKNDYSRSWVDGFWLHGMKEFRSSTKRTHTSKQNDHTNAHPT